MDEVEEVIIEKQPLWMLWGRERRSCQRCRYNRENGTNLNRAQWNKEINGVHKTEPGREDVRIDREFTYGMFLHDMEKHNWCVKHKTLTHQSSSVETYYLENGGTDRVLIIDAPARSQVAICGINQCHINPRDFAKTPHIYTVPHEFSILCQDKDGKQLSPETMVTVQKVRALTEVVWQDGVLYGDLSLMAGGRIKRKEERYYFPQGILLEGGEQLSLIVANSSVAVDRVELYMKCDFFYKGDINGTH